MRVMRGSRQGEEEHRKTRVGERQRACAGVLYIPQADRQTDSTGLQTQQSQLQGKNPLVEMMLSSRHPRDGPGPHLYLSPSLFLQCPLSFPYLL